MMLHHNIAMIQKYNCLISHGIIREFIHDLFSHVVSQTHLGLRLGLYLYLFQCLRTLGLNILRYLNTNHLRQSV